MSVERIGGNKLQRLWLSTSPDINSNTANTQVSMETSSPSLSHSSLFVSSWQFTTFTTYLANIIEDW